MSENKQHLIDAVRNVYRVCQWGFPEDQIKIVGEGDDAKLQFRLPSESDRLVFKETTDWGLTDKQMHTSVVTEGRHTTVSCEVAVKDIEAAPSQRVEKFRSEQAARARKAGGDNWDQRADHYGNLGGSATRDNF